MELLGTVNYDLMDVFISFKAAQTHFSKQFTRRALSFWVQLICGTKSMQMEFAPRIFSPNNQFLQMQGAQSCFWRHLQSVPNFKTSSKIILDEIPCWNLTCPNRHALHRDLPIINFFLPSSNNPANSSIEEEAENFPPHTCTYYTLQHAHNILVVDKGPMA